MRIEKLIVGQLQTSCYLVWGEKNKEAIVIDPGDAGDFVIRKIQDYQIKPKLIVATHGHFDHVLAVPELKLAFGIPFLMHQADLFLLKRSKETAKFFTGAEANPPLMPDKFLREGDWIKFGKEKLKVIETPGHSPGGVALYGKHLRGETRKHPGGEAKLKLRGYPRGGIKEKHLGGEAVLFSGDTLFHQGVGRTDFSYASKEELIKSIKKLFKLLEDTKVYPGHGEETTIGEGKAYLQDFLWP